MTLLPWQISMIVLAGIGLLSALLVAVCCWIYRRNHEKNSLYQFGGIVKSKSHFPVPFVSIKVQPEVNKTHPSGLTKQDSDAIDSEAGPEEIQPGEKLIPVFKASREAWSSGEQDGESFTGSEHVLAYDWKVWLKLCYDPNKEQLECTLFRAATEPFRTLDLCEGTGIFAQLCLLPDEAQGKQSGIYRNTSSPSFDEAFIFNVTKDKLVQWLVRVSLYEQDNEQNRRCLGHAFLELAELNGDQEQVQYVNKKLQSLPMPDNRLGEANVCLCYNAKTEKMTIEVKGVRNVNLPPLASTLYQLRVQVIVGSKSVKTKRGTPDPSLDSALRFLYNIKISHKHMDTTCLRFMVIALSSSDRVGSPSNSTGDRPNPSVLEPPLSPIGVQINRSGVGNFENGGINYDNQTVLGHFLIGPCMYTHGTGLEHWKQMMANLKTSVDKWHIVVNGSAPVDYLPK